MAEEDALYAFERGLRRDLAEKLRVQGVGSVQDAIALTARVGGLMQAAAAGRSATTAAQMEVGDAVDDSSRLDRIEAALNALTTAHPNGAGAKTRTQRGAQQYNGHSGARGGARGGRGGRFHSRSDASAALRTPHVAGVPPAIVEQRRAAGQCYRCGSAEHTRFECTSASSALTHSSN
jgi:hypothetical protein